MERRNGCACPGPNSFRYRRAGRDRQRGADVWFRRGQARRHLYLHAEEFVLGVPQAGDLVFRQHKELGDQSSSIRCRHQVHELYTADRATWRLISWCIHGVRHGHVSQLERRVHHLHDQGVGAATSSEPIAKPEANSTHVATTFSVTLAFVLTNFVAVIGHGRRQAFAQCIARCHAARRHGWKRTGSFPTHRQHR